MESPTNSARPGRSGSRASDKSVPRVHIKHRSKEHVLLAAGCWTLCRSIFGSKAVTYACMLIYSTGETYSLNCVRSTTEVYPCHQGTLGDMRVPTASSCPRVAGALKKFPRSPSCRTVTIRVGKPLMLSEPTHSAGPTADRHRDQSFPLAWGAPEVAVQAGHEKLAKCR